MNFHTLWGDSSHISFSALANEKKKVKWETWMLSGIWRDYRVIFLPILNSFSVRNEKWRKWYEMKCEDSKRNVLVPLCLTFHSFHFFFVSFRRLIEWDYSTVFHTERLAADEKVKNSWQKKTEMFMNEQWQFWKLS